jgi:hypothetical protein
MLGDRNDKPWIIEKSWFLQFTNIRQSVNRFSWPVAFSRKFRSVRNAATESFMSIWDVYLDNGRAPRLFFDQVMICSAAWCCDWLFRESGELCWRFSGGHQSVEQSWKAFDVPWHSCVPTICISQTNWICLLQNSWSINKSILFRSDRPEEIGNFCTFRQNPMLFWRHWFVEMLWKKKLKFSYSYPWFSIAMS